MSDKIRKVASKTFVRPADTIAYAVGDLIANSTVAGNVVPIPLDVARFTNGSGSIRRVALLLSNTALTNGSFRVHLFGTKPVVTSGDNAALAAAGVAGHYLGHVDVTIDQAFTDGAAGQATCQLMFDCPSGSDQVFALIEARAAYVPTSAETVQVTLDVERD